MKKKHKLRAFRVYYFVDDYFSSTGEEKRSKVIYADSEVKAELIFRSNYPEYSFGWADEIIDERRKNDDYNWN